MVSRMFSMTFAQRTAEVLGGIIRALVSLVSWEPKHNPDLLGSHRYRCQAEPVRA